MIPKSEYKSFITQKALELGFFSVGVSKVKRLVEEESNLEKWLRNGYQGEMSYMNNHFDMRLDPGLLVPGAKSVITFLFNYFPADVQRADAYQLSKYAYGEDYHFVLKDKLKELERMVIEAIGSVEGRFFVDSAPILEKAWAEKSGTGWVGKNGNLIHPKKGSFFFIAEWLCDLVLEPDGPIKDFCGTCTRCIDACPTDAIVQPYVVDGSKCISYLTIELKSSELPPQFAQSMNDWMYGCDICQDVCPWNRFSTPHQEPRFQPKSNLLTLSKDEWEDLNETMFQDIFRKSAVKRTKYIGLKRNISFLKQKDK